MNKRFISLNLKMFAAVVLGVFLSVCVYQCSIWLTDYIAEVQYTSEEAVQRNTDEAYASLETYVEENQVKGTDTKALNRWIQDKKFTYLFIYDDYSNYYSAGWWPEDDSMGMSEELSADTSLDDRYGVGGPQIDEVDFEANYADAKNRIVEFADGKYYTYIDLRYEVRFQNYMALLRLSLAFLTLLIVPLTYHGRVLKRILSLEVQVHQVSEGNLDYRIRGKRNDELGRLAQGVDDMRLSIIQKHQREKEAWDANSQLVTSMSHDIRTPLTSMIGYLDIIKSEKYQSAEELERYISSCREKAFQLKELSDKLFQYFLVFNSGENEKHLEVFDANVLLTQIIGEHSAEIIGYGYEVEFDLALPEVNIFADISGFRRLFDNVFSNIMKYADKRVPVEIHAASEDGFVRVWMVNGIPDTENKVESTQIGLKTCERICADLSGGFSFEETENVFTVRMEFPITEESPAESAEQEKE